MKIRITLFLSPNQSCGNIDHPGNEGRRTQKISFRKSAGVQTRRKGTASPELTNE